MSLVIDASVFIASARAIEREHQSSLLFLASLRANPETLHVPSLVIPECVGAMVRVTGDPGMASETVLLLEGIPNLEFVPLSTELARSAARVAASCRLRGSDACYVAVAEARRATLITWDTEMLDRGAAVVRTVTPEQWLEEQNRPGSGV